MESDWPNCPRYFKKNYESLKTKFIGAENLENNWSQSMQDIFVLSMLNGKKNGIYVEIGADKPKVINNTYLLESEFDWLGVSFELDDDKVINFNDVRKNKCICADLVLPLDDYRFSVITYETDVYSSGADIQDEQIEILESHGYQLVSKNVKCEGNPYEDWWIDPAIVSEDIWKPYKTRIGLDSWEVVSQ